MEVVEEADQQEIASAGATVSKVEAGKSVVQEVVTSIDDAVDKDVCDNTLAPQGQNADFQTSDNVEVSTDRALDKDVCDNTLGQPADSPASDSVQRSKHVVQEKVASNDGAVDKDAEGQPSDSQAADQVEAGEKAAHSLTLPMRVVMTGPPVRLRMSSADRFCPRSMLVEWEDGSDERQTWVSSEDPLQAGWYEAEKLLPPSATNITVQFKIRGLHKKWDVCMVDRQNGCSWIMLGQKRYTQEIICFRVGSHCACDPIDAIFELKGPIHRCFVHRAWNAAREGAPQEWEYWDDEDSRPPAEGSPATLLAADCAAAPQTYQSFEEYMNAVTSRFCAAALELLTVHRETLRALSGLDAACSGQWLRANVGTTTSAGLMIAAVPCFFLAPPVGIGLAVAGSVAGGAAMGGNSLEERWSLSQLRGQLSRDGWNAFVTAELLKEWLRAAAAAAANSGSSSSQAVDPGSPVRHSKAESGAAGALKTGAYAIAFFGDEVAAALPVLGPIGVAVGAVLTTGIAIHGWTTSKFSQKEVRGKMAELKQRLINLQSLLARLGQLQCPICSGSISETDSIVRCLDNLHCCHASCLQVERPESDENCTSTLCPTCAGSMDMTKKSLAEDVSSFGSSSPAAPALSMPADASEPEHMLDEGALFQMLERLYDLESSLLTPPEDVAQMSQVVAKLSQCQAGRKDLEELAANAAQQPDSEEMDLILSISETNTRLQHAVERFETWKAGVSPSLAAEFASAEKENTAAQPEETALNFQPPDRLENGSTSASSVGSANESSRSWKRRISGPLEMAAQKASALGQSASRKATAAASELKGKAWGVKDKAAGMATSLKDMTMPDTESQPYSDDHMTASMMLQTAMVPMMAPTMTPMYDNSYDGSYNDSTR